jgi:LacI family transcriptional regulator
MDREEPFASKYHLVATAPASREAMPRRRDIPRVLLLVETSSGYGRAILEGIGHYVREHGPWSICFEERGLEDPPPRDLAQWQGEGIIARTATRVMQRQLLATGLPMVELLGCETEGPAKVHGDNLAGGRMAAEHLLDCRLGVFGFYSCAHAWWIDALREGYVQGLRRRGYGCHVFTPPQRRQSLMPHWSERLRPAVGVWLRQLPKPVGIFVPSNLDGRYLLEFCRGLGIAVPEQAAILAAGDDPAICGVTTPPLSSIDFDSARIGYQAAALLERLMRGRRPPRKALWIPPTRVVVRQSSDVVAIADDDVAKAVRFIREQACQGISVLDVANAVALSRRMLERRFRMHLGRTPRAEILRVQMDQARYLLGHTDLSVERLAAKAGFVSFKHFARAFRREAGMTPRAYRKAHRLGA